MSRHIQETVNTLQPWTTICANDAMEVAQDFSCVIDTSDFSTLELVAQLPDLQQTGGTGIDFIIETASLIDGSQWKNIGTFSSPSTAPIYLEAWANDNAAPPLYKFLRWRIKPQGAVTSWQATFDIQVTLK